MTDDPTNFNQSQEILSAIVEQLEGGDLSLEDALKTFEKGIQLTREAQKALADAEQKVNLLLINDDEPHAQRYGEEHKEGD